MKHIVKRTLCSPRSEEQGKNWTESRGKQLICTARSPGNEEKVREIKEGVCKTWTGYLRMADADGKMRIEKCRWKKVRITKKVRGKKREMRMAKKKKIKKQTNKQTKERNLSYGWTPHLHTEHDANSWHSFVNKNASFTSLMHAYLVHFSFQCLA